MGNFFCGTGIDSEQKVSDKDSAKRKAEMKRAINEKAEYYKKNPHEKILPETYVKRKRSNGTIVKKSNK